MGLRQAQNESDPLPALCKSKSGGRDTCALGCQMLSAYLSSCWHAPQAGLGTEWAARVSRVEVTAPVCLRSHLLFFCLTILLLLLSALCLFPVSPPGVGRGGPVTSGWPYRWLSVGQVWVTPAGDQLTG